MESFKKAWEEYKKVMDDLTADTSEKLSQIKKERVEKRAVAFKEFWKLDLKNRKEQYVVIKKYYKKKEIGKYLKQHLYFNTTSIINLPKTIEAAIKNKDKKLSDEQIQKLLDEEIKFERKVLKLGFFEFGPIEDVIKKWRKKNKPTRNKPTRKEQFDKFWTRNFGKKKPKKLKF